MIISSKGTLDRLMIQQSSPLFDENYKP